MRRPSAATPRVDAESLDDAEARAFGRRAAWHPVRASLASGIHDDASFDALYEGRIREASEHFWTPVAVACRATALLAQLGARNVLDVGSGPGKVCIAGAATQPHVRFAGVEQRAHLVEAARHAAARMELEDVTFVHGNVSDVDWARHDGFYFFNPFGENLYTNADDRFDDAVVLSNDRYLTDVAWAEHKLAELSPGSVLVTYHGFGGGIPASYELVGEEACGTNRLRVWVQSATWRVGCWRELYDGGVRRGRYLEAVRRP